MHDPPPISIRKASSDDEILLGVLTAIERDANTSQRNISNEIGVALGLANAYLKRCVRKGLIKVQQVPRRRYAYYLTPQGFAEKARLTGQYLTASFTFFRRAREQLSTVIAQCERQGQKQIAIAGVSDLAEVAILCAQDRGLKFVAMIDASYAAKLFHGVPVVAAAREVPAIETVIVTALDDPASVFQILEAELGKGRVLAPPLLRLVAPQATAPSTV